MNCCCHHDHCGDDGRPRRTGGFFRTLFSVLLLYATLVFGGGTLINTGHPVAVEAGRLMQLVTFVEPTIGWASHRGYKPLATGLRRLAAGAPIGPLA